MKNWEIYLLMGICFIVGAVIAWGVSFETYYNRGVSNTKLYYETTGNFPTTDWVKASEHKTYRYPEQIRESLKEFTLAKGE